VKNNKAKSEKKSQSKDALVKGVTPLATFYGE